jgi:hypothetical protein
VCETKATGAAAADDRDPCLKVVTESESEEEEEEEEDGDDVKCFFFFFFFFGGIAKMAMIHWKIYSNLTTS